MISRSVPTTNLYTYIKLILNLINKPAWARQTNFSSIRILLYIPISTYTINVPTSFARAPALQACQWGSGPATSCALYLYCLCAGSCMCCCVCRLCAGWCYVVCLFPVCLSMSVCGCDCCRCAGCCLGVTVTAASGLMVDVCVFVCCLWSGWTVWLCLFSHLSWTHWANTENRSFVISLGVCNFFMSHSLYYYQRWAHSRYNNLKKGLPQGHICNLYSKINVSTTANPHICNHFFVTSRQLQARNFLRKGCAATVYLYSHNRNFFSRLQIFEVL